VLWCANDGNQSAPLASMRRPSSRECAISFLERAHCRGAYTTESRFDDRRSMREFLSWILCPVVWPLAIFVGSPRWRVKEGEGFEA
jgi:hypothetical protein